MKIIGTSGRDQFIVVADARELARVAGYHWERADVMPPLMIGASINVSELYERLVALRGARGEILKVSTTLRAIVDLIAPVGQTISNAQGVEE